MHAAARAAETEREMTEPPDKPGEKPLGAPEPSGEGAVSAVTRGDPRSIARLAHELKTPLSAIAAAAEIMRDERLGPIGSERYRGYAADIHSSARHALGVINRMLEVARCEAAEARLSFTEIDLNGLVESVLSGMQPLAAEAGLSLVGRSASRLPHVVADETSLRQILLNLLTNAIKFTGAGGEVVVSTGYRVDGPVTLEVRDNGPGMKLDAGAEPVSGSSLAGPGLGLGLPLVKALAAENGAVVEIETAAGRGTAVRLVFRRDRTIPV
jgi:signal transduction histidine kinase